jgi:hypothetical protein
MITAPDLFSLSPIAAADPVVLAGLAQLADRPPLWGSKADWAELVAGLRAFEDRWGKAARTARWSLVQLYGLCPVAPRARLSRMGGAFLACLPGRLVADVDAEAISVVGRTAARLRIFKAEPAGAVVAWRLTAPP